jgi:adenine phosphoribosyltransferase
MAPYERHYRGQATHTVTLFDEDWELPIVEISAGTYIASNAHLVLGTADFVAQAADALAARLDDLELEYLVTPEAKALPLTQAIGERLEIDYAVVRKHVKDYMTDPTVVTAESITTDGEQQLVLDGPVADDLQGARVAIVDDAVSTGGTMAALETILDEVGAEVVSKAAIFAEGRDHAAVHTLTTLPLYVDE